LVVISHRSQLKNFAAERGLHTLLLGEVESSRFTRFAQAMCRRRAMAITQNERVATREVGESRFETPRPSRPIVAQSSREEEVSEKVVASAFSFEALAAAATVVLTILGLAAIYPVYMVPIAILTTASAMIFKSSGIASRFNQLVRETGGGSASKAELEGGMSAELLGGFAGIALGVLALIGFIPATLSAVAVIVFGGAMLFGGGETFRVSHLGRYPEDRAEYVSRLMAESASGGESLVGIAAVVLGILALVGIQPVTTLVLVGLLSLGGAMLMSGTSVSLRMLSALR
jgi:hypothetical protein